MAVTARRRRGCAHISAGFGIEPPLIQCVPGTRIGNARYAVVQHRRRVDGIGSTPLHSTRLVRCGGGRVRRFASVLWLRPHFPRRPSLPSRGTARRGREPVSRLDRPVTGRRSSPIPRPAIGSSPWSANRSGASAAAASRLRSTWATARAPWPCSCATAVPSHARDSKRPPGVVDHPGRRRPRWHHALVESVDCRTTCADPSGCHGSFVTS